MTSYPSHLIRPVDWLGERLLIRPVRPDDAPKFIAGALLCSAEDLRFRFLRSIHHLSEKLAAQLTQIDYERHMAFVAENLKGDILAVSRLVGDTCKKSAEYALIVRTDLQKRGLGGLMHNLLLDYAAGRGITELWGIVDSDNRRALGFVRRLGFRLGFHADFPFTHIIRAAI
ncbi:MAG TPA: GNAT family N-acetyltransferase [Rhizomicrobium sp.]